MRRLALVLVIGSVVPLIVMAAIATATGATQEAYEYVLDPIRYAKAIADHAGGVRAIMAFDVMFIVFYTAFFTALAEYLRRLRQPFTYVALAMLYATAILDVVEDHHILSLLGAAEAHLPIDADSLVFQQTLSSTKFTISYLALFLFGLAIPRTSALAWALVLFLTLGTLASGVVAYAAPPDLRETLDRGRWIGFLVGFCVAAMWLRRAPEPAVDSG